MEYLLKRSKRKTIGLTITADKQLIVRAPRLAPLKYIEKLLEAKKAWIQKHLQSQPATKNFSKLNFVTGEQIPFFGNVLTLGFIPGKKPQLDDTSILLSVHQEPRLQLLQVYKKYLKEYLQHRVPYYSEQMDLQYKSLRITSAKKRLGSCNSKKNVCFSYYNAILPTWVIDYIIVHELAHLKELNHSNNFWNLVAQFYPDFKQAKRYVREHFSIPV